ncbi:hypothetical protein [Aromatoleum buckelii]|nr:hypothetical protein [Aromatoleum buckelii]MCK0511036.1 hypothetical protein [Aromatoleum buckelii]
MKPPADATGSAAKVRPAWVSENRRAFPAIFFTVAGYPNFIATEMRLA